MSKHISLADLNIEKLAKRNPHLVAMMNKKTKRINPSEKISYEKRFIESHLSDYCEQNGLTLIAEHKFCENRKFRFDWCILELKEAIEYEGLMSKKSRHTTIGGFSKDTEKYNLAASLGYTVYRYTALTYKQIINQYRK